MLQGRAALVTGASEGLGVEIARHYVAAGASVMVCARSAERLEAVADDLRTQLAAGQSVAWMACDVTDAAAVERLVAATLEAFGSLHVLVNNAGKGGAATAASVVMLAAAGPKTGSSSDAGLAALEDEV